VGKKIFFLLVFFLMPFLVYAEDITITTYYPSPFGNYRELRAARIAIGDNYIDGAAFTWETTDGDGGEIDYLADLVVEGNVGIGTTTPSAPLCIGPAAVDNNGNLGASLRAVRPDDGNGRTFYYTGYFENSDNSYFNAGLRSAYRGTCSGSAVCWALYGDASGGAEDNYGIGVAGLGDYGPGIRASSFRGNALEATQGNVIINNGNVGIGTGTVNPPAARLEIGTSGDIILKATANDPGDIIFQASNGVQKGRIWSGVAAGVNELNFSSADNSADITINPAGLVGIGTSSPGLKLDVNGTAMVRENFLVSGIAAVGGAGDPMLPTSGKFLVYGGLEVGTGRAGEGPFRPDPSYYVNDNFILFRHRGISEDFIGYKNNNFYFADALGGSDVSQPVVWAAEFKPYSSRIFKENISPLGFKDYRNILEQIKNMNLVYFRYKGSTDQRLNLGVIAEDAPGQIVDSSRKGLSLSEYVSFLAAGLKEVINENEALKKRVAVLEEILAKK